MQSESQLIQNEIYNREVDVTKDQKRMMNTLREFRKLSMELNQIKETVHRDHQMIKENIPKASNRKVNYNYGRVVNRNRLPISPELIGKIVTTTYSESSDEEDMTGRNSLPPLANL